MDYVEGSDLAALVREKPLPAKRAAPPENPGLEKHGATSVQN
jgi:hypothetical protein